MVKFNRYNVTNGNLKARVSYHLDNRTDGRKCVTLYAKDYRHDLGSIFGDNYTNDTDLYTDYFDQGRVVLFEDHKHYAAARARAEENNAAWDAKHAAQIAAARDQRQQVAQ